MNTKDASRRTLKVFHSLEDLLDALECDPIGPKMAKENNPVVSQDVLQVLWKLFFGDSDLESEGKKQALMLLGLCGDTPILGWNFKSTGELEIIALVVAAFKTLSESAGHDVMTPLAEGLLRVAAHMKERADLAEAEDGEAH